MSQILSGLVLAELQRLNPNPVALEQQTEFANAMARAIQTYLNQVTVAPGQVVTTTGTAAAQRGTTTTPGNLITP